MTSTITAKLLDGSSSDEMGYLKHNEYLDQLVYEFSLQPGFKECANLSRTVYFTSYLSWIGKVRELFMSKIGPHLVPQISSGEWGLVTNWCDLKIFGEATTYDDVLARFRLGHIVGAVIPLQCEFFKVSADKSLERLAYVEQETTWVEVIAHGKVRPAEFPSYFDEFLKITGRKNTHVIELQPLAESLSSLDIGEEIYRAPLLPGGIAPLFSETFKTSLEDSNLVGNVYYGNYFIWQGRVRDLFINSIEGDYLRGIGDKGELICIHSRLDYLRDAMPFDQVNVTLSVRSVYQCGATLEFQYFRVLSDGDKEKLAVGQQQFIWAHYDDNNNRMALPLPEVMRDKLLK